MNRFKKFLVYIQGNTKKTLFDQWNEEKKELHLQNNTKHFINERDIRYIKLSINIGFEQNGKSGFRRHVLLLKKVGSLFTIVPLTTKLHHLTGNNKIFYHKIISEQDILPSAIILSQLRIVDKKRFLQKMGNISEDEHYEIIKKVKELCL